MNDIWMVRDFKKEDENFIYSTFLRGLYYGDSWFSLIPKDIFMENYKKFITMLLSNPKVTIKVACLNEDPDTILGYSILSSDFQAIHWCFVKDRWRKQGIARAIIPQYPTIITHLTKKGKDLMYKFPDAIFNPFYL